MQLILNKAYDFDTLGDYNRDIIEAINHAKLDTDRNGIFTGSFKINIIYDEQKETLEDWDE